MAFPEGIETATVLLRRPLAEIGTEWTREAALELDPLPLLERLRRLGVERRGDGCGAAPIGDAGHDDGARNVTDADLHRLTGRDLTRGLDALAADLDVAGEDEIRRGTPRLREPRGPQPFVDPHSEFLSHYVSEATIQPNRSRKSWKHPSQIQW